MLHPMSQTSKISKDFGRPGKLQLVDLVRAGGHERGREVMYLGGHGNGGGAEDIDDASACPKYARFCSRMTHAPEGILKEHVYKGMDKFLRNPSWEGITNESPLRKDVR